MLIDDDNMEVNEFANIGTTERVLEVLSTTEYAAISASDRLPLSIRSASSATTSRVSRRWLRDDRRASITSDVEDRNDVSSLLSRARSGAGELEVLDSASSTLRTRKGCASVAPPVAAAARGACRKTGRSGRSGDSAAFVPVTLAEALLLLVASR